MAGDPPLEDFGFLLKAFTTSLMSMASAEEAAAAAFALSHESNTAMEQSAAAACKRLGTGSAALPLAPCGQARERAAQTDRAALSAGLVSLSKKGFIKRGLVGEPTSLQQRHFASTRRLQSLGYDPV